MEKIVKALIVENEFLVAKDLTMRLQQMGYTVIGRAASGDQALQLAGQQQPTIIFMDIDIDGALDGIETARILTDTYGIPIIFLTKFEDDATFSRAKKTKPADFLNKPFDNTRLRRAVELALERDGQSKEAEAPERSLLKDRIFVKDLKGISNCLLIDDIVTIKADGSYCTISTATKSYQLTKSMSKTFAHICELKTSNTLMQVHRSYVVNLNCVLGIEGHRLCLGSQKVDIGKSYREQVKAYFQVL